MADLAVVCADIGSIEKGNFGWHAVLQDGRTRNGQDIGVLVELLCELLNKGHLVAFGVECPLFVPLRTDPYQLLKMRNGETNPNWIGGPGATVLATGLVELTWLLREMKQRLTWDCEVSIDWLQFRQQKRGLFLWEAFVSGKAKKSSHILDAEVAVQAFRQALPNLAAHNAIVEGNVISLAAVALLRSGFSRERTLLEKPCLAIRA